MATSRTDNFVILANGQPVECRLIYCYLGNRRDKDWQNKPVDLKDRWHEATILIPKRSDDLLQAPYVGPKEIVPRVWEAWVGQPGVNGQWRPGARWPILDCDIINPATGGGRPETEPFAKERPYAAGHWRINASSNFVVHVFDQANLDIPKDISGNFMGFKGDGGAGGDYGYVSIHAWAYLTGSAGVSFGIEAVKKTRDGDMIGGQQRSPEQIFGGPAPQPSVPPIPQGYAPQPQYQAPTQTQPAYAPAPPPGFTTSGAPSYQGAYAPPPGAPAATPYGASPAYAPGQPGAPYAPGGNAGYPSSGAPVAPYPPPPQQGMPPAPPPPFGSR